MEDLRVLEQQQRDSQRKLATIKLTKQHKIEQRASLESKLSSLKYANGEQRAQLARARDVLSRSTRELGSAKLLSGRSGEALKAFDARLKKALFSARTLQLAQHKLDSGIIELRNKQSIILRLKSEVIECLKGAEKHRDDTKHGEQTLRQAIHAEKVKAQRLIEESMNIRSDVSGLEEDLPAAQQMAVSTKLRAESILCEINAEDTRHAREMQALAAKLAIIRKQKVDKTAQSEALKEEVGLKKTQLKEAWKRCTQYQQEEGHKVCPEPSEDCLPACFVVDKLKIKLNEDLESLRVKKAAREALKESITRNHEELASFLSMDKVVKEEAQSLRKVAEAGQKTESARREANEKFLDELGKERSEVLELQKSVSELEKSRNHEQKQSTDQLASQAQAIESRQLDLERSKVALATADITIQEFEGAFEKEEGESAELVGHAKQEADSARAAFEKARHKVELLEKGSNSDLQREVEEVEQAQSILVEDTKDAIAELYEGELWSQSFLSCSYSIAHVSFDII